MIRSKEQELQKIIILNFTHEILGKGLHVNYRDL